MKRIHLTLLCAMLAVSTPAFPQNAHVADEAAIKRILTEPGRVAHSSPDLDWENAFGRRFGNLDEMLVFLGERLAPTMTNAVDTTQEIRVNFVTDDVAVADQYWTLTGQTDDDGKVLADRRGRDTYIFRRNDKGWTMVVQRIADLRN